MAAFSITHRFLADEARSLLTRLARVKSFSLNETMVPAASLSLPAQTAIERQLAAGRRDLRRRIRGYLRWLGGQFGRAASPADAHRRFAMLRLMFNAGLAQFDLFSQVITQRSEHETGVWLSGLDVVADDALALPGYFDPPPVACYLDRGPGAAIRRARTRLPGGGDNPIAIVRVPRERMIGSAIASSLIHEVGHQAAALLDLVPSLRGAIRAAERGDEHAVVWGFWERWISEIVADFWSVARLGIGATLGLMSVVSLPRAFVFRLNLDDPHPSPWIRVKLSCAMGRALFPDPQWDRLAALWESFYPTKGLSREPRDIFRRLERAIPPLVDLMIRHRPASLRGRALGEVMQVQERRPDRLASLYDTWRAAPALLRQAPPSLVFAVIGQARSDGRINPELEARVLANLLTYWALRSNLDTSEICATQGLRPTLVPASRATITRKEGLSHGKETTRNHSATRINGVSVSTRAR
jgi:hypothetical protein